MDKQQEDEAREYLIDKMIRDVAENGGEYSFKTVKGKIKDIHRVKPGDEHYGDYRTART